MLCVCDSVVGVCGCVCSRRCRSGPLVTALTSWAHVFVAPFCLKPVFVRELCPTFVRDCFFFFAARQRMTTPGALRP